MSTSTPQPRLSGSANALLGIAYMVTAASLFPFLNAGVKYLAQSYPVPQVIWFRYFGHLVFLMVVFMPSRGWRLFRTAHLKQQLLRSALLFGSTCSYFFGVSYLPLATGASINMTGPIVVTALAAVLLREKVGIYRWSAVMVGFLGALVIIRPGSTHAEWPMLFFLGSLTCFSLYQIVTRMAMATEDSATAVTYTAIVGAVGASFVLPFYWTTPTTLWHAAIFLSLGVVGGTGHYLVVKALQHAEASTIAPINYGQLVGAVVFGYIVFGDFPDPWTWVGAAIVMASGLFIAYRERIRGRS